MIFFDIETDGLLDSVSQIHMLAYCREEGEPQIVYGTEQAGKVFKKLAETGEVLCGHNIIGYDLNVLERLCGVKVPTARVFDTLVLSRLMFADIGTIDSDRAEQIGLPSYLIGSHGLEAWGYRLKMNKGEFKGPWKPEEVDPNKRKEWIEEMAVYCQQDVRLTRRLYQFLQNHKTRPSYSQRSIDIEHSVAHIINRQCLRGVAFDQEAGNRLMAKLIGEKRDVEKRLKEVFGCWYKKVADFVPKVDSARHGYIKDVPLSKVELVEFNPGSRQHIAKRLGELYGFVSPKTTDSGAPSIDETVLKAIKDKPGVQDLINYLLIDKRMSQLYSGDYAWLSHCRNGRIYGKVNSCGAVTGRMTHSSPNLAQVPKVTSPYGTECRSLFTASKGMVLVGCDASGIEGRTLAHYCSRYGAEGVEYGKEIYEGDIHWKNVIAFGLVPEGTVRVKDESHPDFKEHKKLRDTAKTAFYALMYGAGAKKLAAILGYPESKAEKVLKRFFDKSPVLSQLSSDVERKAEEVGFIQGIDGRRLKVREAHKALNTLLQSCGAIIMKVALVHLDTVLQSKGLVPGVDYEFVLNVHDEFQIEVLPEHAKMVGETAVESIKEAGRSLNLRVPLDGEYAIGNNWAETH